MISGAAVIHWKHRCLVGVGVGIGIGVEKSVDQHPIPMPIATPTPKDIVILTFYDAINFDTDTGSDPSGGQGETVAEESSDIIEMHRMPFDRGYVQVYTGDGKGKTTAAIGLALRAAGAGLRVFIAQFVKSGRYSEVEALERFSDLIVCRQYGRGCWLRGKPSQEDVQAARGALKELREIIQSGAYQVVILDEANIATWFELFSVENLLDLIDLKPERVELVFTGRRADPRLIERADLVTEMREVKHYYEQGVLARKGIES